MSNLYNLQLTLINMCKRKSNIKYSNDAVTVVFIDIKTMLIGSTTIKVLNDLTIQRL